MLMICCPWCGPREETEFFCAGEAVARPRPSDCNAGQWSGFLHERSHQPGPRQELWRHEAGCGQWLLVERDRAKPGIPGVTALGAARVTGGGADQAKAGQHHTGQPETAQPESGQLESGQPESGRTGTSLNENDPAKGVAG